MASASQSAPEDATDPPAGGPAFSPLYQQIKALIMRGLQTGEWRPGEAIPSEVDLAARFRVSQGTVRKAIDELAAEHLLVRRQGKGTFVTTHAEERVQYRFLRLMSEDGQQQSMERRFIDCRRVRAPAEITRTLDLRAGEIAVQVRRLLHVRGQPVVLDDIWLRGGQFKGLTAERLTDYRGPMYALFETEFGVRMIRAEERIRAIEADEVSAELLLVPLGSALLSVERLSYTYGDQPVEFRRGLYNTRSHYYRNELS